MDERLLEVCGLTKVYAGKRTAYKGAEVHALRGINLSIGRGRTLAVIGESGSGKSTLARCIVQIEAPTSGQVRFAGTDLARLDKRQLQRFRSRMQLVLQGTSAAINPGFHSWEVVAEPLEIQKRGTSAQQKARAVEFMQLVGLSGILADRLPHQLSGGQLQRLAIARALVLEPELLVLDEPFTGLDVSIQAQIANLLLELQTQRFLSYLLIAHDLALASNLADEMAILQNGAIVETAPPADLLKTPRQAYSKALLAAAFGPAASARSADGTL